MLYTRVVAIWSIRECALIRTLRSLGPCLVFGGALFARAIRVSAYLHNNLWLPFAPLPRANAQRRIQYSSYGLALRLNYLILGVSISSQEGLVRRPNVQRSAVEDRLRPQLL
jgi:hypothetical protein